MNDWGVLYKIAATGRRAVFQVKTGLKHLFGGGIINLHFISENVDFGSQAARTSLVTPTQTFGLLSLSLTEPPGQAGTLVRVLEVAGRDATLGAVLVRVPPTARVQLVGVDLGLHGRL